MRTALLLALSLLSPALTMGEEIPPCFPGAYYRKAVSRVGKWTGIEATVILPEFVTDPERIHPANGRQLDNTSMYLGGLSHGQEIDAGLTWEVIRDGQGVVSKERAAFRPFWRNENWYNAPTQPEFYYMPGDTVRMRCAVVGPDELELSVVLLGRAPESKARIEALGVAFVDAPSTFTTVFAAPGFNLTGPQEFKRVNAIDQSGNEGLGVSPTRAMQRDLVWREVVLLEGEVSHPFTPALFLDMRCPSPENVVVTADQTSDPTSERVSIRGTAEKSTTRAGNR